MDILMNKIPRPGWMPVGKVTRFCRSQSETQCAVVVWGDIELTSTTDHQYLFLTTALHRMVLLLATVVQNIPFCLGVARMPLHHWATRVSTRATRGNNKRWYCEDLYLATIFRDPDISTTGGFTTTRDHFMSLMSLKCPILKETNHKQAANSLDLCKSWIFLLNKNPTGPTLNWIRIFFEQKMNTVVICPVPQCAEHVVELIYYRPQYNNSNNTMKLQVPIRHPTATHAKKASFVQ